MCGTQLTMCSKGGKKKIEQGWRVVNSMDPYEKELKIH